MNQDIEIVVDEFMDAIPSEPADPMDAAIATQLATHVAMLNGAA